MDNNNSNFEPQGFSPFDAPKKEVQNPTTDNDGVKLERVDDTYLDGNKGQVPPPQGSGNPSQPFTQPIPEGPKDAPEFTIPKFDQVPNSEIPNITDQPPGSGNSGSGNKGTGSGDGTKVEPEFAKEFGEFAAKWIVDIYFRFLIMGIQS